MPWFDTFSDDDKAHITNRGWHTLSAADAAAQSYKAFRESERMRGVPAERLLTLPDKPDAPEWANVWQRLGAPEHADGYNFGDVKHADGSDLDANFTAFARDMAHKLHLPAATAAELVKGFIGYADTAASTQAKESAGAAQRLAETELANLKGNWGDNFHSFKEQADRAAVALGVDPDVYRSMQNGKGGAAYMDQMRKIGARIMSEASFVSNGTGGAGNQLQPMTVQEAESKKAALLADRNWRAKWSSGDTVAAQELDQVERIIVGARFGQR